MFVVCIILTVHPQGPYGYPILRNLGWVFAVMSKSRRMAPGLWGGSLDWVTVEELKFGYQNEDVWQTMGLPVNLPELSSG